MTDKKPKRVMWLLNHTTLRKFEIAQFKLSGIDEIFLPKSFPYNEENLSTSITYDEDKFLTIPPDDLAVLNTQNWYKEPSQEAWDIANRHFDIVVVAFFIRQIEAALQHFEGGIILRVFGLDGEKTYSNLIRTLGSEQLELAIRKCGRRFSFGIGYDSLTKNELKYLADRAVLLPVGMNNKSSLTWEGNNQCILFICPRIETSTYYKQIYKNFINAFGDFDYIIGGAQPLKVNDPKVLGFIPDSLYAYHMQQSRVMFYHSQEPNHIHYHPFEAIRAGMPLVFMAGGMLDKLGGHDLPGRAKNIKQARKKIKKILNGDWKLIRKIQESQHVLLDAMKPEVCGPIWQKGFQSILSTLSSTKAEQKERPAYLSKRKKIAVILPNAYRGGSLRGAQLLAHAIYLGSRQYNEPVDVTLCHLDNPKLYPDEEFSELPESIQRRAFQLKETPASTAQQIMLFAGFENWIPKSNCYTVFDDGISQLQDFDLWFIVSDRILAPPLPLRPIALMIYDYLQRYEDVIDPSVHDQSFLEIARFAKRVFVTTEFTYNDAKNYAGVSSDNLFKLPMLPPLFFHEPIVTPTRKAKYFIWTTNPALHKNHESAFNALRIYYEQLFGKLKCWITGYATTEMFSDGFIQRYDHLNAAAKIFTNSSALQKHIRWKGELSDTEYQRALSQAHFLWHPARVDNGTFSVIEAACLGVPSLSSDYPAMREMNEKFSLNLCWLDPYSPKDIAKQLKFMEENADNWRTRLPTTKQLTMQSVTALARTYWEAVRKCL